MCGMGSSYMESSQTGDKIRSDPIVTNIAINTKVNIKKKEVAAVKNARSFYLALLIST